MEKRTKLILLFILGVVIGGISAAFIFYYFLLPTHLILEAENAEIHGLAKSSETRGYSGTGYVTNFDNTGDQLKFYFLIRPGIYELKIFYASPLGNKKYDLMVNDKKDQGIFPQTHGAFDSHSVGKYIFSKMSNSITIEKGWGWFDVDRIELIPATPVKIQKTEQKPADPEADKSAKKLLKYLEKIYGRKTLTGQYGFDEIEKIKKITGREPAIGGFDLMDYSPSRLTHGADPKQLTEKVIKWAEKGGIVTLSWHWNAPDNLINQPEGKEWWKGFYANATSFDLNKALQTGTQENKLLLRDLDAIAAELKKIQAAGIPVLWRPMHEPQGKWFWWGAHGPENYVKLWRLMFNRFTQKHQLHNLLWVYSPVINPLETGWYPGDDVVDIIGADIYSAHPANINRQWEFLQKKFGSRKLIALSECDNPPNLAIMEKYQIHWLWYSPWFGKAVDEMHEEEVKNIYSSNLFIKKSQLPNLK